MKTTSAIIFHLLAQNPLLTVQLCDNRNLELKRPRIYFGEELEPGFLYVVGAEYVELIDHTVDCTLALHNCTVSSSDLANRFALADLAFIESKCSDNALFDALIEIFLTLAQWDAQLKDALQLEDRVKRVFEIGKQVVTLPYALFTKNYEVICFTPDYFKFVEGDPLFDTKNVPREVVQELLFDEEFRIAETHLGLFYYPKEPAYERYLCQNIFQENNCFLARILAEVYTDEVPLGERLLFKQLCHYISQAFLKHHNESLFKRQNDSMHVLFRQLIAGERPRSYSDILGGASWKEGQRLTLIVVSEMNPLEFDMGAQYLCQQLERNWEYSCAIAIPEKIVWIVNRTLSDLQEKKQGLFQSLAYLVRDLVCKAGISEDFHSALDLSIHLRQAEEALAIGQYKDPHFWYYFFSNYTLDYILKHAMCDFSAEQLSHRGIFALMAYDAENKTELVRTLHSFIQCNYNIPKAAESLYLHRTTLLRRMEKIVEITQLKLNDPDTLLHLAISFRILDEKTH